jgi:hypothetical protein
MISNLFLKHLFVRFFFKENEDSSILNATLLGLCLCSLQSEHRIDSLAKVKTSS